MSQVKKLDNLINKVIEEELTAYNKIKEQSQEEFITSDGTSKTLTTQQKDRIRKAKPGTSISYRKAGSTPSTTMEEGEIEQEDPEEAPAPSAADIAGKMSEILDKLNNMSEMKDDPKYEKHAAKAAKYMEAAKSALEGLTNYETMLEEKDKQKQEKEATGLLNLIRRALNKLIKDKTTVEKIMNKMPVAKALELLTATGKNVDEQKVAKAMLNVALKESFLNQSTTYTNINEEDGTSSRRQKSLDKYRELADKYMKDDSISKADKNAFKDMSFIDKQKVIFRYGNTLKPSTKTDTKDDSEKKEEPKVDADIDTTGSKAKIEKAVSAVAGSSAKIPVTIKDLNKFKPEISKYADEIVVDLTSKGKEIFYTLGIDNSKFIFNKKKGAFTSATGEKGTKRKNKISDVLSKEEIGTIIKALSSKVNNTPVSAEIKNKAKEAISKLKMYIYGTYFSLSEVPEQEFDQFLKSIDIVSSVSDKKGLERLSTPEYVKLLGKISKEDEEKYLTGKEKNIPIYEEELSRYQIDLADYKYRMSIYEKKMDSYNEKIKAHPEWKSTLKKPLPPSNPATPKILTNPKYSGLIKNLEKNAENYVKEKQPEILKYEKELDQYVKDYNEYEKRLEKATKAHKQKRAIFMKNLAAYNTEIEKIKKLAGGNKEVEKEEIKKRNLKEPSTPFLDQSSLNKPKFPEEPKIKDYSSLISNFNRINPFTKEKVKLIASRKEKDKEGLIKGRDTGLEEFSSSDKDLFVEYLKDLGKKMYEESRKFYTEFTNKIDPLINIASLFIKYKNSKSTSDEFKKTASRLLDSTVVDIKKILADMQDEGYNINSYLNKLKRTTDDAKTASSKLDAPEEEKVKGSYSYKKLEFEKEMSKYQKDLDKYKKDKAAYEDYFEQIKKDPDLKNTLEQPPLPEKPTPPKAPENPRYVSLMKDLENNYFTKDELDAPKEKKKYIAIEKILKMGEKLFITDKDKEDNPYIERDRTEKMKFITNKLNQLNYKKVAGLELKGDKERNLSREEKILLLYKRKFGENAPLTEQFNMFIDSLLLAA